jgi:hypothetical protein
MWTSAHRVSARLPELSRRDAKWLSANDSNNLACTGVSAEPMRLSPYDAPDSADASRTSGNAAPLAGRLHERPTVFIFLSCIQLAGTGKPVFFLIDEIFSGTNSRDRRIAAEAVVRTLLDRGAIGALSTHNMSLTTIANFDGLCGANVCMGSRDGSDPMDFDYRLKPGIGRESNALAIARMAGVPV